MNAQERDLLQSFLREVSQSRPAQKDLLAESMIYSALGSNPDALYLLVQRALGAETALRIQAKQFGHLAETPRSPQYPGAVSFLGNAAGVAAGVVAGSFLIEGVQSALQGTPLDDSFTDWLSLSD